MLAGFGGELKLKHASLERNALCSQSEIERCNFAWSRVFPCLLCLYAEAAGKTKFYVTNIMVVLDVRTDATSDFPKRKQK